MTRSSEDGPGTRPLNLTRTEIEYLWEMMKQEVGKEDVQYGPNRDTVESMHTKVRRLYYGDDDE